MLVLMLTLHNTSVETIIQSSSVMVCSQDSAQHTGLTEICRDPFDI